MQLEKHALYSPSSAHRWMLCAASPHMEALEPHTENKFAAEGTLAHDLRVHCLITGEDARKILFLNVKGKQEPIPQEMAEYIQESADKARNRAESNLLLVEQRLELEPITGEKGATGTADEVILAGSTLIVTDYKHGVGVPVSAQGNPQIRIYGLATLRQFDLAGEYETIKLRIDQPRIDNEDEEILSAQELISFGEDVKKAVVKSELARKSNSLHGFFNPGEEQCRFCKAKAKCPALADMVSKETSADFEDESQIELLAPVDLGTAMSKVELIEGWLKGVRAKVESELLSNRPVKGWKLVEGKKGARAYADETAAEKDMKALKLADDEMYDKSLRSPAQLEKKLKKTKLDAFDKISKHFVQKKGKPSVAPISDPRPVYNVDHAADFEEVE